MGFTIGCNAGNFSKMPGTPVLASSCPKSFRHLLLVEDNPLFAEQLTNSVAKLPGQWRIDHFRTGEATLAALSALPADAPFTLALIDIGLPDMNGIEVIRACRDHFPEMPIVVVSVISVEESLLDAIRAGASGYILKNDSIEQIAHDVAGVLDGNYPLSPQLARFLFKQVTAQKTEPVVQNDFELTPRQIETLKHLAQGASYEQVAQLMGVALSTVQTNIRNLYRKLNVRTQAQAVSIAHKHNLF